MIDLNDFHYYAAIVDAGSLSGASRRLGVTKSLLSQHLAKLELHLGVRLIQRTTRKLQVTPVGLEFHQRCRAVLAEVERAQALVDEMRGVPRGRLRISCPVLFAQVMLAPLLGGFLRTYPDVDLVVDADYRDVDLIGEGYDLALRAQPDAEDSRVVMKSFGFDQHILVASPGFLAQHGTPTGPDDLAGVTSAAVMTSGARWLWHMFGPDGTPVTIAHRPRLQTADFIVLKHAVLEDVGVALMPRVLCADDLATGRLRRVLPDHLGEMVRLHAAYPSRTGLSHAARVFLDYLGEHLTPLLRMSLDGGTLYMSLLQAQNTSPATMLQPPSIPVPALHVSM